MSDEGVEVSRVDGHTGANQEAGCSEGRAGGEGMPGDGVSGDKAVETVETGDAERRPPGQSRYMPFDISWHAWYPGEGVCGS